MNVQWSWFNGLLIVGFHGYDNVYFRVTVIDGVYGWLWFLLLIFVQSRDCSYGYG